MKPASVISTSYTYNEADFSAVYAARQCAEYAKLGLQGVTVLYVSGDNGVEGGGYLCLNDDGKSCNVNNSPLVPAISTGSESTDGKRFNTAFPSSCPWVTSVGATMMKPNATVFDPQPEQACEKVIYSGGGFSNYFSMPDYQKNAVGGWFAKYGKEYVEEYGNAWNSTGNVCCALTIQLKR